MIIEPLWNKGSIKFHIPLVFGWCCVNGFQIPKLHFRLCSLAERERKIKMHEELLLAKGYSSQYQNEVELMFFLSNLNFVHFLWCLSRPFSSIKRQHEYPPDYIVFKRQTVASNSDFISRPKKSFQLFLSWLSASVSSPFIAHNVVGAFMLLLPPHWNWLCDACSALVDHTRSSFWITHVLMLTS